jgi:hypothetical protein
MAGQAHGVQRLHHMTHVLPQTTIGERRTPRGEHGESRGRARGVFHMLVHKRQSFCQDAQPLCGLSGFPIRLSQQAKQIGQRQLAPHSSPGVQTLVDLLNARFCRPLLSACPALQDGAPCQPAGKSCLTRELQQHGGLLLDGLYSSAVLMEYGRLVEGKTQAVAMGQRLGHGKRLVAPGQGAIWVPKHP